MRFVAPHHRSRDRRQEAGDRIQEAGGRRQGAGDRIQEAGDRTAPSQSPANTADHIKGVLCKSGEDILIKREKSSFL